MSNDQGDQDRLSRLMHNHSQNRAKLQKAGIAESAAPTLFCRSCGYAENALFWTPHTDVEHSLHVGCPSCESYDVRFRLRRGSLQGGGISLHGGGGLLRLDGLDGGSFRAGLAALAVVAALAYVTVPPFRAGTIRTARWAASVLPASSGQVATWDERSARYGQKGDLRSELAVLAEGTDGFEVEYIEERDVTVVTVQPGASQLHEALARKGWFRL